MATLLQIALLLLLIALIGMIIGYLFGKLSCKKNEAEQYFQKNDYCENVYPSKEGLFNDIDNSLSDNKETIDNSQTLLNETTAKLEENQDKKKDSVEDLDKQEGKPLLLSEPRGGKADNLCRIKGIGFVIEEKLHNLGVYHFDQIASWGEKEIEWVDKHLAFSGRILREDWVGQAKKLAAGEDTEFSKRVDKGEVSTSRQSSQEEK